MDLWSWLVCVVCKLLFSIQERSEQPVAKVALCEPVEPAVSTDFACYHQGLYMYVVFVCMRVPVSLALASVGRLFIFSTSFAWRCETCR